MLSVPRGSMRKMRSAHATAVDRKLGIRAMSTGHTLLVDELVDGGLIT